MTTTATRSPATIQFVVHLVITNNTALNNRGARPVHEVFMQWPAEMRSIATREVIEWHKKTFGPMDVEWVGTRAGTI